LTAVGVDTGEVLWKTTCRRRWTAAPRSAAGSLHGDQQGVLYAFDAANGDDLWQADLKLASHGAVILLDRSTSTCWRRSRRSTYRSEELGEIGAKVIAFKLGGKKLPPGRRSNSQSPGAGAV